MKRNVIVFGKGNYYKTKKEQVHDLYNIKFFVDNSLKPNEKYFDAVEGVYVYNPKEINEHPTNDLILLMSVRWFEMWHQLMSMGIEDERIIFGINLMPCTDIVEEKLHAIKAVFSSKNRKVALRYGSDEFFFTEEMDYKKLIRKIFDEQDAYINLIKNMPLIPSSKRFGNEKGEPIDRYYIEKFISENAQYLSGTVMEIAEQKYTKMFGQHIEQSLILHVNGWGGEEVIKGNLATGEGIQEAMVDCLVCTQTINCIYDIHSCVKNIHKLLRTNGTVLITCPCIAQLSLYDYRNWGEYWRFTEQSLRKLLQEAFKDENIKVVSYGNVKAAIAFLYGICVEQFSTQDLEYKDIQYPLIIGAVARKE